MFGRKKRRIEELERELKIYKDNEKHYCHILAEQIRYINELRNTNLALLKEIEDIHKNQKGYI